MYKSTHSSTIHSSQKHLKFSEGTQKIDWLNKLWYIHMIIIYSNENEQSTTARIPKVCKSYKNNRSQSQRSIHCMIPFM